MNLLPDSIILCVISAKYSCVIDSFFPSALLWGDSFMHVSGIFNHTENHPNAAKKVYMLICSWTIWNIVTCRVKVHTEGNIIFHPVLKSFCFTVSLQKYFNSFTYHRCVFHFHSILFSLCFCSCSCSISFYGYTVLLVCCLDYWFRSFVFPW